MKKLDAHQTGMALGVLTGLIHAAWSALVFLGLSKPLLDFIYGIHFLSNPFIVAKFNFSNAVILVIFTTAVGYIFGGLFAWIWNWLHGRK
ncbi:hypothetical protein HZB78_03380 [Candidatus Collierbacteria bacterium]|nr:hypothetical protein [Candidatus Collierbacteria bacterium]